MSASAGLDERLSAAAPVAAARRALDRAGQGDVWLVGGTVRDALLGRSLADLDLAVECEPEAVARRLSSALGGPVFPLGEAFGAWRVLAPDRSFTCDVSRLRGAGIEEDLARRDFTVNAMAVPLAGGELVDPRGGRADLEAGVLRLVPGAYAEDPIRPLRLARLATELGLRPEPHTERATAEAALRVHEASPERVFGELRRILAADRVLDGVALAGRLGLLEAVLPEVAALRGVEQSEFHHLDVYEHTLEVLRGQVELESGLEEVFGPAAAGVARVLAEPLGDELSRRVALRMAALLHDIGKPATRGIRADGRGFSFIGHDRVGAEMVGELCRRLRTSERLREFLAGICRHHLVLGFLVHERPLSRRAVYRYLTATQPVEVEVTLLTCADRLATRGRNADRAIAAHLALAAELMPEALAWRSAGPPRAPLRGDELAAALGIEHGPELGRLLRRLEEARFTGQATAPAEAVELARRMRDDPAA